MPSNVFFHSIYGSVYGFYMLCINMLEQCVWCIGYLILVSVIYYLCPNETTAFTSKLDPQVHVSFENEPARIQRLV